MKTKLDILTLLKFLLILSMFSFFFTVGYNSNINQNSDDCVHINSINHKGYYSAPENTLAAFRLSSFNGFSMVECDVRLTKDGIPVVDIV